MASQSTPLSPSTGGRPPIDREILAQDLIEWVQDEDHWEIKKWRVKHMIPRQRVMEMCQDSEHFRDAYSYALDTIAVRRQEMNHNDEMKDSLYGKHLKVYDRDVVGVELSYDDYIKDKELARKKELLREEIKLKAELGIVDSEHDKRLQECLDIISSLQAQLSSARKIAARSNKAEDKS